MEIPLIGSTRPNHVSRRHCPKSRWILLATRTLTSTECRWLAMCSGLLHSIMALASLLLCISLSNQACSLTQRHKWLWRGNHFLWPRCLFPSTRLQAWQYALSLAEPAVLRSIHPHTGLCSAWQLSAWRNCQEFLKTSDLACQRRCLTRSRKFWPVRGATEDFRKFTKEEWKEMGTIFIEARRLPEASVSGASVSGASLLFWNTVKFCGGIVLFKIFHLGSALSACVITSLIWQSNMHCESHWGILPACPSYRLILALSRMKS